MDRTRYGSRLLARASGAAPRVDAIPGTGLRALAGRIWAGLPLLIFYRMALPSIRVPITSGPTGRLLSQQLSIRTDGRLVFRFAQGVLFLPPTYAEYLRGRHRQAVRTNVRRARDLGLSVTSSRVDDWAVHPLDPRSAHITAHAPLERWTVHDADGRDVANAMVTVDARTALLHLATAEVTYARWLLHAAIVERLCGQCELLLTNTEDVPLMRPGTQHYQRLLGYSIVRLSLESTLTELLALPALRILGLCLLAALAIVTNGWLLGPGADLGISTLVWVTALVAIRRISYRAGPAAATGVLASALLCLGGVSPPLTALGFALAGMALDVLLAKIPRLTWSSVSVAPAGVTIAVLALFMSELGRWSVRHGLSLGATDLWTDAMSFGALAAGLGWWLGGHLVWVIPRSER